MAKKASSPKKPSTKASSRTRSTTSSTTAKTAVAEPAANPAEDRPALIQQDTISAATSVSNPSAPLFSTTADLTLTAQQREGYLHLLSRGAPPIVVCQEMGISLAAVAAALETDPQLRSLVDRIQDLLSQNVAAALYRNAIQGSVTAQQFYLRNRPPPEWPSPSPDNPTSPLDALTDEELLDRFHKAAAHLPPEISRGIDAPVRPEAP